MKFLKESNFQGLAIVEGVEALQEKISQCKDTSPSTFINLFFGRGPLPFIFSLEILGGGGQICIWEGAVSLSGGNPYLGVKLNFILGCNPIEIEF